MTRKPKYYLTREKLERHPAVLLLDKYGRMSFKQLMKCLGKDQICLSEAERKQRDWIQSKIEQFGMPIPDYEEDQYLFGDLERLFYQGMVHRVARGKYEAIPKGHRNPLIPNIFNYEVGRYRQRTGKKNMRYGGYIEAKPVSLKKMKTWEREGWPFISSQKTSLVIGANSKGLKHEHKKGFYIGSGLGLKAGIATTSLDGVSSLISPYSQKQILFKFQNNNIILKSGGVPREIRKAFRENNMRLPQKVSIEEHNGTFHIIDSGNSNKRYNIKRTNKDFIVTVDLTDLIETFSQNVNNLLHELIIVLRPMILSKANLIIDNIDEKQEVKNSVMRKIEQEEYYIDLYEDGWKIFLSSSSSLERSLAQKVVDYLEVPIITGLICPLPRKG